MKDSQYQLLNYTKKLSDDVKFLTCPRELLLFFFHRTVSRLEFKTEQFNFHKGAESIEEIRSLQLKSLSWEECCYKRARELLELKKDHYYIAFSGGIDSTTMIVALLQTWPKDDLKRVTVLLSHHSVEENPSFFDKYVVQFPLRNFATLEYEALPKNSLILMGELGDQLYGSDMLGFGCRIWGDEILWRDYREATPLILDAFTKREGVGKIVFEYFHPIVEECPFPIRSAFDFFWWFNFTQKWQHVKYRFVAHRDWDLSWRYGTHLQHFYDTPEFQTWSLNNHDLKIGRSWKTYKDPAKQFIFKFTRDPAQLELMKIQSLEKTFVLAEDRIAVTKDYHPVESLEDLKNYVRFNN